MCVAATRKRRARQMKLNEPQLPPKQRPHYRIRDIETAKRHEARIRATAQRIAQGGSTKGKNF